MKRFLYKLLLYLFIETCIIVSVFLLLVNRRPDYFLFVSNSISHNLKAGFVNKHAMEYKNAAILVIGSSMALNNVNAKMIQDSLHRPVMNVSSWGMKIVNLKGSPVWNENKTIIYEMQFADFGKTDITLWNGLSFTRNRFSENRNAFFNFNTYLSQAMDGEKLSNDMSNREYTCCRFDACGSVLFSDSGFNVSRQRWDLDMFRERKVDTLKLNSFVSDLQQIIHDRKSTGKIIISFSPGRRKFYNTERSEMVRSLGSLLQKKCPGVYFINKYDDNVADYYFVDNSHFNTSGASLFTRGLIDSIGKIN